MPRSNPDPSRSSARTIRRRNRRLAFVIHINELWSALPKPMQAVGWAITAASVKWIAARAGLGAEMASALLDILQRA